MKKVKMFMFDECPHCQLALRCLDQLMEEDEYKNIEITQINEKNNPEIADQYDYYFVPTFYVDEKKVHEGHAEMSDVKRVLDLALE